MKLLFRLLAAAGLAYVAGALLLVKWNPEAEFWDELRQSQIEGLGRLREEHPGSAVVLFCGGSSCAFSVDPGVVTAESGRLAYNIGTSAWAGPRYYVDQAFKIAGPGDVLVVAIEPNFLTQPGLIEPSSLGAALAWRGGDPAAAAGGLTFGSSWSLRQQADLLRPGARYLVTWTAKALAGGPSYQYGPADHRDGGRLETGRGHPTGRGDATVHPSALTVEARELLETIARAAKGREVRVVYSLPWYFTAKESVLPNREARSRLLTEIRGILPVLEDPALGVQSDPALFSDTHFHLTARGSQLRSEVIGRGLAKLPAD